MWGLQQAMAVIPAFSVLAAAFFLVAARCYDHDVSRVEGIQVATAQAA
jgi:MFS transporter, Spinster family, sphingosine-1-phosphate transporter